MANRERLSRIAGETVEILDRGAYTLGGRSVSVAESLDAMRAGTRLYTPEALEVLVAERLAAGARTTRIDVRNCTTFAAAASFLAEGCSRPVCLNFASAKNPGGGFRSGAQAQEESLARASGLYASLSLQPAFYDANRAARSALYTDHLVYSPSVPVFRSDHDELLAEPFEVSIITSPAVNARAISDNAPADIRHIPDVMAARIRSVLAVALEHGHDAVVLGAWGCGVFGNPAPEVAAWFAEALLDDPRFVNAFERVTFAVLDRETRTPTLRAFSAVFTP